MKILFVSGGSYERLVKEAFRLPDTPLTISESCRSCIALLNTFTPDLIITNYVLPDATGQDLAVAVQGFNEELKIILLNDNNMSGHLDSSLFFKIVDLPIDPIELRRIAVSSQ
ncbi:MAG: hypothetical protein HRU09_13410 [Oligoflexales bacterium]|nr:hypothetical protein [Oligoflexales bacterium]